MTRYRYVEFQNDVPASMRDVSDECKPFDLRIPIDPAWKQSKQRILVVLQHVDSDDLKSKDLLSSTAGTVLHNLFELGETYYRPKGRADYALAAINFNFFKTYHLESEELRSNADKMAARRVLDYIQRVKPHKVLIVGDTAATALLPEIDDLLILRGWAHRKSGYDCDFYSTVDFSKAYAKRKDEDGDDEEQDDKVMAYANLLGYSARIIANMFNNGHLYKINVRAKAVLIDTVPKFDKLLNALNKRPVFAYDTESDNLNKVKNRVLTMQFGFGSDKGYIVPLHHKDSPFTARERKYIESKMQEFWARYEDPLNTDYSRYYIGQNLKFDNTLTRQHFGVYTIKRRFWDLIAGEYVLDENMTGLKNFGTPAFNLLQLSLFYGSRVYLDNSFKKSDRGSIADRDLSDQGFLDYMALDVQVPFAIHEQQIARAHHMPHNGGRYAGDYARFVLTQMNNIIHIQSIMEHRGSSTDVEYMKKLSTKDGALENRRREILSELRSMKNVKRANTLVEQKQGKPQNSLFGGKSKTWSLSLTKPEHKRILFFDVLGLKPLRNGKSGDPSTDKEFQSKYKEVPEIKLFNEISQIDKLLGTYVRGFLRKRKEDPDYASDDRLRPGFGFADTVTGRSNSYGPNLQNIPTRGMYAKYIKRIFAAKRGRLKIKMDYSAHEVRVWSVVSGDFRLGALFDNGRKFRQLYRKTLDPKYKLLMDTEGDIHIQNVSFFFQIDLKTITDPKDPDIKTKRDMVKSIVFGAIYGRGASSIAKQINQDKKEVERLLKKFFPRFPKASKWLEDAKKSPLKHMYVAGPTGRRRNLFAHLYEIDNLVAAVERRGCNSPVQALAADMGHTAAYLFGIHFEQFLIETGLLEWAKENGVDVGNVDCMVHDSISGDFPYELYLPALQIMQWCATIGCMQYYARHYDIKFTTALEVEFELGANDAVLNKWDWSEKQLEDIVRKGLEEQKLAYPKMNVDKAMAKVYAIRKNTKVVKFLDKHYPVLPDLDPSLMLKKAA